MRRVQADRRTDRQARQKCRRCARTCASDHPPPCQPEEKERHCPFYGRFSTIVCTYTVRYHIEDVLVYTTCLGVASVVTVWYCPSHGRRLLRYSAAAQDTRISLQCRTVSGCQPAGLCLAVCQCETRDGGAQSSSSLGGATKLTGCTTVREYCMVPVAVPAVIVFSSYR